MSESNPIARLEAFCDAVFAIALTLLIIDIKITPTAEINNTSGLWSALRHISPSIFAFVLSFIVILITWVNHHACLKLVNKSSAAFFYSNGFLLLTVVFIPFPTSLMGEYVLTDHAAPAVFLYNAVIAIQGLSWILMCGSATKNHLTKNEKSNAQMQVNQRNGYFALIIYSILAILALWIPLAVAIISTLTWIFWLIFGIRMKHD
jgi:uncharacterized membrane protein